MLDNHQIELVHADVDGELPAGQRGELSRLLLANPEARALHDELRRLSRLLDGLPKLDPPAGLASAVLDGIPWQQAARSAAPAVSWWHTAPRIAAAMAAGALLTATVYHLARPFGDDVDGSEVSGTMASHCGPVSPRRRNWSTRSASRLGSRVTTARAAPSPISVARPPSGTAKTARDSWMN